MLCYPAATQKYSKRITESIAERIDQFGISNILNIWVGIDRIFAKVLTTNCSDRIAILKPSMLKSESVAVLCYFGSILGN